MTSQYRTFKYVVRGAHPFPVDMLRRDRSFPQSENDAGWITISMSHMKPVPINIILLTLSDRRHWTPETARWKSFGWDVVSVEEVE